MKYLTIHSINKVIIIIETEGTSYCMKKRRKTDWDIKEKKNVIRYIRR